MQLDSSENSVNLQCNEYIFNDTRWFTDTMVTREIRMREVPFEIPNTSAVSSLYKTYYSNKAADVYVLPGFIYLENKWGIAPNQSTSPHTFYFTDVTASYANCLVNF